jgi:hypothetical protein
MEFRGIQSATYGLVAQRPGNIREGTFTIDLKEVMREGVDWIHLAQNRGQWQGSCELGNEPSGSTSRKA